MPAWGLGDPQREVQRHPAEEKEKRGYEYRIRWIRLDRIIASNTSYDILHTYQFMLCSAFYTSQSILNQYIFIGQQKGLKSILELI